MPKFQIVIDAKAAAKLEDRLNANCDAFVAAIKKACLIGGMELQRMELFGGKHGPFRVTNGRKRSERKANG